MKDNEKDKIGEDAELPPLTDDELKMVRAAVREDKKKRKRLPYYDNSDGARLLRESKRHMPVTVLLVSFAAVMLVLLTVLGAWGIASLIFGEKENTNDYTVIIGDKKYTEKYRDMNRDGVFYVDMYKIADYTGMIRTGSVNDVKFTTETGHYLRFEDGSQTAVINGNLVDLGGTSVVNAQTCEVPFEFLSKALVKNKGLRMTLDKKTNTLTVKRGMYEPDENDVFLPVEIMFTAEGFSIIEAIIRPSEPVLYEYTIDVTPFLDSIDPADAEQYLILANKQTPLGENYTPADLEELRVRTANGRKIYLCKDAETALYAMVLDMKAAGINDFYVTSAYRSYSYQVGLFDGYVQDHMENDGMTREEAEAAALEYSARPGTSEHQTGLCIDFMTDDMNELDESFEDSDAYRWLSANAHKYGFILRYPEDKVDTTGYKYEPWHYRFVGRTVAAEIYASNMCLEEYLELN